MNSLRQRLAAFKKSFWRLVLPPLQKALPLDSRSFGAPRRVSSTPDYCRKRSLPFHEVYPAKISTYKPPICINFPESVITSHVFHQALPTGVAVLKNVRVASPNGWIIGEDDTFLPDHTVSSVYPHTSLIYRKRRFHLNRKLPGRTLLLSSDHAHINFCHVVADSLPRAHLFEKAGICSYDELDRIIVPNYSSPGPRKLIDLMGIPTDKLLPITDFEVAECEELIAPTYPGVDRCIPPWVIHYWQSLVPAPRKKPWRRLYVPRKKGFRAISNEEEILPILQEFGFEILDPGNDSPFEAFQEAEIIVAPHGAALIHVVFCQPKTVLIELMSPLYIGIHYYTSSNSAGMDYYSILGTVAPGAPGLVHAVDYAISPDLLRKVLQDVTSKS